MPDPRAALTHLTNALPADPAKDGPIGVDSADLRAVLAAEPDRGAGIRSALSHHLDAGTDPCQDRGVDWPCDVADALGGDTP
jgi:hypothetical protein